MDSTGSRSGCLFHIDHLESLFWVPQPVRGKLSHFSTTFSSEHGTIIPLIPLPYPIRLRFVMQERKQFVVTCKDCQRAIPTGAKEFPFQSITIECPQCGELRRYLPSEVFLG